MLLALWKVRIGAPVRVHGQAPSHGREDGVHAMAIGEREREGVSVFILGPKWSTIGRPAHGSGCYRFPSLHLVFAQHPVWVMLLLKSCSASRLPPWV